MLTAHGYDKSSTHFALTDSRHYISSSAGPHTQYALHLTVLVAHHCSTHYAYPKREISKDKSRINPHMTQGISS
jgi:hypothetical protein